MELWTHVKSTETCKPRRHCVSESDGSNLLESKQMLVWRTTSFNETLSSRAESYPLFNAQSVTRLVSRSEYHNNLKFELKQRITPNLLLLLILISFGEIYPASLNLSIIISFCKEVDLHFAILKEFGNVTLDTDKSVNSSSSFFNYITFYGSFNVFDIWSMWLMLFIGGVIFGVLLLSIFVDKIGRKRICILNSLFCIFCSIFCFLSSFLQSKFAFSFAIFLTGIYSGISRAVGLLYMVEIVSYNLRGLVGVFQQISASFPFVLVSILKLFLIDDFNWQYLFLLTMLNAISILIFLPWFPDSPRHIFLSIHNFQLSFQGLQFLRKKEDVYVDIEEMETENHKQVKQESNVLNELKCSTHIDKDLSNRQNLLNSNNKDFSLTNQHCLNTATTPKEIQYKDKIAQQKEVHLLKSDNDNDNIDVLDNIMVNRSKSISKINDCEESLDNKLKDDNNLLQNLCKDKKSFDAANDNKDCMNSKDNNLNDDDKFIKDLYGNPNEKYPKMENRLKDLVEVDESFEVQGKEEIADLQFLDLIKSAGIRKPIFIAVILKAILHFSSAYFLFGEMGLLVTNIGNVINRSNFLLLSTSIYFFASLLSLLLLRVRRRSLQINSLACQLVIFIILVAAFNLTKKHKWVSYVCLAGYFINIIIYAFSAGWLSSLICFELFRQNSRGTVGLIPTIISYLFAFLFISFIHFLQPMIGPYILLLNVFGCLFLLMLAFGFVPETNLKTFEEISELFSPASPIEVLKLVN